MRTLCPRCGRLFDKGDGRRTKQDGVPVVVCVDCVRWMNARTEQLKCLGCGRDVERHAMTHDGPYCDVCLRVGAFR